MKVIESILDVSPYLGGCAAPKSVVHNWNDFENLSENTTGILVVSNNCNEGTVLDLDPFKSLQYLEIGDDSFKNVTTFNINGLSKLTLIYIGKSSFTLEIANALYSFRLLNCNSLINLEIGEYSFSEYTGVIELSNLPSLENIKIGALNERSSCFSSCYLHIHG